MGQAAVRPVREIVIRRTLAWALAFAANGALIVLILVAPRPPAAPAALTAIDLVLVATPEPEIEPDDSPPEIAPSPPAQADMATATQARDESDDEQVVNADLADDEEALTDNPTDSPQQGLAAYEISALPETAALTGTPFIVREIFCMTSSEANREAGHCSDDPDPDGLAMLRFASDANLAAGQQAAIGHGMSAEQIHALFEGDGLGLTDLRGRPTLADTSRRPTSSADQMRDSLPPRHPDPVFGD
ncbi:hypothetical protein [uncultured Maricaulis sp.]|uniref:hypothetical protein n=1 Tax=uncultured Maricaulis sp. TaxID=174710 RepID=UPI0030D9FE2E